MPKISFENACVLPLAGTTALQVLKKTNIIKDHKVLVSGAGGTVGTMIIQMLKDVGCEISVVTSKPLKAKRLGVKNIYFMKNILRVNIVKYFHSHIKKIIKIYIFFYYIFKLNK